MVIIIVSVAHVTHCSCFSLSVELFRSKTSNRTCHVFRGNLRQQRTLPRVRAMPIGPNGRIQCGEPGCTTTFEDARSRERHRRESCKKLEPEFQPFCCPCGGRVRRWSTFVERHKHAKRSTRKSQRVQDHWSCKCKAKFDSFTDLQRHYAATHEGNRGRPRSNSTPVGGASQRPRIGNRK